jgi:hypothetical protein
VKGLATLSRGVALFVAIGLAPACGGDRPTVTLTVRLPANATALADAIRFEPSSAVRSAMLMNGELSIVADASAPTLTVRAPGLCPVTFTRSTGAVLDAAPRYDLGGDRAQVGYDAAFAIDVTLGCPEAARGHLDWRQVDGLPLLDWRVEGGGLHVRARTRPLAEVHPHLPAWGIVPASPTTQGRYVLEATWRGDGPESTRTVTITSMTRATGVPSVAVGQRVMLAGSGWHVHSPPPGGRALVHEAGVLSSFEADVGGHWMLQDGAGRLLGLRAGRFDTTPLGCGTSECHHDEHDASVASPMTHALERQLGPDSRGGRDVSCMLDCHVLGERGLHDGGFLDRAAAPGWSGAARSSWSELPRTLRRVGGVGCTACHGPGAIPERTASRAILRVDVCATCHDAPPTYVHVAEWQSSRMAHSDDRPESRASFACARCHMTSSFLAAVGAHGIRFADEDDLHAEPAGIGCAACHAAHKAHAHDQGTALVRAVPLPPELEGVKELAGRSAVCIPCHSPVAGERIPSASAASIVAGRVALPGSQPAPTTPRTHDQVPGGCIGCHGGANPDHSSRVDHSFRVDPAACGRCHGPGQPVERADERGDRVQARAIALWSRLRERLASLPASGGQPVHAAGAAVAAAGSSDALERALYEVMLVLEDPAAGVHNAPFARELLRDAEASLRAAGP